MTKYFIKYSRQLSIITLVFIFCASISGCGFKPVHKSTDPSGGNISTSIRSELSQISIAEMKGRIGHKIRNHLSQDLGSNLSQTDSRYLVSINSETSTSALLIQDDDKVSRYNLSIHASFTLYDYKVQKHIFHGDARSIGSFNVVDSEFATAIAEQDAEDRAAKELSVEIYSLLIAFFVRTAN